MLLILTTLLLSGEDGERERDLVAVSDYRHGRLLLACKPVTGPISYRTIAVLKLTTILTYLLRFELESVVSDFQRYLKV